jgi:hypothetical protein
MALDPNIALNVKGLEVPNPVAQYAQVAQLQSLQNQNQVSQMQLDQMRRDDETLRQIQAKAVENGGPSDLGEIADAYLKSGNPKFVEFGIGLRQKLDDQAAFKRIGQMGAAPAPINAMARPSGALGSGTFGVFPEPTTNALAPAPAPTGPDVNTLRAKRDAYIALGTPQSIEAARAMNADIALMSKESPDTQTMRSLGYPLTTEGYKLYRDAQRADRLLTPDEEAQRLRIAAASRPPGTTVTMVSERAEQGARGKMLVDQYGDISKAATLATKTLPSIEANLSALNKGFDTGFGKETVAAGASVLAALGVKDAEKFATDSQKFQSNAITGILQKQLEQKGPQTESDARRIEQIGAQLGKTKNANEFILATAKEQLKRDVEQRNFYDRWYRTNKTYDGAEDAWFNGEGGKSLFDRPGLKKYGVSAAPTETPAAANKPSLNSIFKPKRP